MVLFSDPSLERNHSVGLILEIKETDELSEKPGVSIYVSCLLTLLLSLSFPYNSIQNTKCNSGYFHISLFAFVSDGLLEHAGQGGIIPK
jgi:hypothetical protein